jgi:hypothetical protein
MIGETRAADVTFCAIRMLLPLLTVAVFVFVQLCARPVITVSLVSRCIYLCGIGTQTANHSSRILLFASQTLGPWV